MRSARCAVAGGTDIRFGRKASVSSTPETGISSFFSFSTGFFPTRSFRRLSGNFNHTFFRGLSGFLQSDTMKSLCHAECRYAY